jgi:hypothetical protein
MKLIYVVYNDLHLKLSKSFSLFYTNETLGPTEVNCNHKFSNKSFDFRSFHSIFIFFNKKRIINLINQYDYLGISCINFTMNNLLYSNFSSRNVFITYDGLINLQSVNLTPKEKFKDVIKFLFFSLRGLRYTIRKNTFSGIDIFKMNLKSIDISKQLLPIHFFLNKNSNRFTKINSVLYISIANDAIDLNNYLQYEKIIIQQISYYFKQSINIIYKEGINDKYINKNLMIHRNQFKDLTAEEIVYLLNYDIVCGDVSSLLFNTKLLNPSQKTYSIGLDKYCNIFEKDMIKHYTNTLEFYGIKILN